MSWETLKLRIVNHLIVAVEKQEGKGIVYNPADLGLREIAEAMVLDGASPSAINRMTISLYEEQMRKRHPFLASHKRTLEIPVEANDQ